MNKRQRAGLDPEKFTGWRESHIDHKDRIAFGLNLTEYAVIDFIHRCTKHVDFSENGWTKISYKVIGRFFSLTKRGTIKLCQRLEERDFLILKEDGRKKATQKWIDKRYDILTCDLPDLEPDPSDAEEGEQSSLGGEQSSPLGGEQSSPLGGEQSSLLNNKLKRLKEKVKDTEPTDFSISDFEKIRVCENLILKHIKPKERAELTAHLSEDFPTLAGRIARAFVVEGKTLDETKRWEVDGLISWAKSFISREPATVMPEEGEGDVIGHISLKNRLDAVCCLFEDIMNRQQADFRKGEAHYKIRTLLKEGETIENFRSAFQVLKDTGASKWKDIDVVFSEWESVQNLIKRKKEQEIREARKRRA